jgi:anaphase-promoting complex subunit 8
MGLSHADEAQLKAQLQHAVVSCTERCLYNSAKWCVSHVVTAASTGHAMLILTEGLQNC